jgi:hypothetical protein
MDTLNRHFYSTFRKLLRLYFKDLKKNVELDGKVAEKKKKKIKLFTGKLYFF